MRITEFVCNMSYYIPCFSLHLIKQYVVIIPAANAIITTTIINTMPFSFESPPFKRPPTSFSAGKKLLNAENALNIIANVFHDADKMFQNDLC